MKIFGKKSLSSILQPFFKFAFYLALIQGILVSIWIGLSILFHTLNIKNSIAELVLEGDRFQLTSNLLDLEIRGIAPYNLTLSAVVITFLGFILLFKWLAELFKAFSSESVFRKPIAITLHRLALLMVGTIFYRIIMLVVYSSEKMEEHIILVFQVLCAIIFYFIAKLIEQGIPLQEEQELTI